MTEEAEIRHRFTLIRPILEEWAESIEEELLLERINEPEVEENTTEGLRDRWRTIFPAFQNPAPPPSAVERIGGLLNWPAWNDRTYPLDPEFMRVHEEVFQQFSDMQIATLYREATITILANELWEEDKHMPVLLATLKLALEDAKEKNQKETEEMLLNQVI